MQVVDDTDELSLATKRECIRKVKEAKAAAAAAANANNEAAAAAVDEDSVASGGLPKRVNYPSGDLYVFCYTTGGCSLPFFLVVMSLSLSLDLLLPACLPACIL